MIWLNRFSSCAAWLRKSKNEHTLYLKQDSFGLQLVISLYVDDMLVTGSNEAFVNQFKAKMENLFEMSYLGKMNYFLGMEFVQNN